MMTKKQLAEVNGRTKMLHFELNNTNDIIGKQDRPAFERHQTSITSTVNAADTLKSTIKEKKFAKGRKRRRKRSMELRNRATSRESGRDHFKDPKNNQGSRQRGRRGTSGWEAQTEVGVWKRTTETKCKVREEPQNNQDYFQQPSFPKSQ